MKNTLKIILSIIIIAALGVGIYFVFRGEKAAAPVVTVQDSVLGCYTATLGQDVYTMSINTQQGENVSGTLAFKNFEKDSSSGTFSGTYKDGILLGIYSFNSEGMQSDLQVIFKKTNDGFIRGYGDMNQAGDRFADLNNITYDTTYTFKPSACVQQPMGKLPAGSTPPVNISLIQSHDWVWQKTTLSNGTVVTPKKAGALTFGTDNKAAGKTDCNSYFAQYTVGSDGFIKFDGIGSTLMFCEGSQESVFTGELAKVSNYTVDASGNLVLKLSDSGSMTFKK